DPAVRAAGATMANLTWTATGHSGSVPLGGVPFDAGAWITAVEGRAALGSFVDAAGTRYVLIANSDSLVAQTLTLTLPGPPGAPRLGSSVGAWGALPAAAGGGTLRVPVALESGGFALLRIDGTFDLLLAGRLGPTLALLDRPAHTQARFELGRLAAGARLELV